MIAVFSILLLVHHTSSLTFPETIHINSLLRNDSDASSELLVKINKTLLMVQYEYVEPDASLKSWTVLYEEVR